MEELIRILGIFLGSTLGALLGIYSGVRTREKWKERVDAEKREQLLHVLKEAVNKNGGLIEQVCDEVEKNQTPTFNVDLTLLESTATIKYDLLDDMELCSELDELRYELTHLSRKIDRLFDLHLNTMVHHFDNPTALKALREGLVSSIVSHIEPIRKSVEQLKTKL